SASGNVQDRQALRLRVAVQDVGDDPSHIVHMDELYLVLEILLPAGKHAGQPFTLPAHLLRSRAFAIGSSAKCSQQVVAYRGSGKNVRSQNVNAAPAKR